MLVAPTRVGSVLPLTCRHTISCYIVKFVCSLNHIEVVFISPRERFTKESELASSNLVKSRGREIGVCNYQLGLTFDRRLRSSAAEPPVKFQIHRSTRNIYLAASRLDEIWESQHFPLVTHTPNIFKNFCST